MSKSEFATRQLKKHGWKEGSGLGKEEHGRADPIKVTLKMDKTGVGHDPGKEFTDHWWLRVFNEAAQKIGKKDEGELNLPRSEEEKAKSKKEQQRKIFYKGFVQSATLTNGVEEKCGSSDSSDEDEKDISSAVSVPTLEDIHKFCGGATGHRAASFGIRMEGKIKRASHHEKQFEEKAKRNGSKDEITEQALANSSSDFDIEKRKQKKKKRRKEEKIGEVNSNGPELSENNKALKRKLTDLNLEIGEDHQDSEAVPVKKKKKKKKNKSEKHDLESGIIDVSEKTDILVTNPNDSSGETEKELQPKTQDNIHEVLHETEGKCKKKKKKKKKQD